MGAAVARERRLPRWSPERLERLQAARVRAIVGHAHASVPFYREAMDERGLRPADFRRASDLALLPLVTPAELRSGVERFTSSRVPAAERELLTTSGTEAGGRGEVYWDREFVLRSLVTAERDRAVIAALAGERRGPSAVRELVGGGAGERPRRGRLADPSAAHRRISIFPSDIAARRMRVRWSEETLIPARSGHHEYLHAFTPLAEAAERFTEVRPRVVFSYGSYADQFLRYADARGDVPLPVLWVVGGDAIGRHARAIAGRHGVRVLSVYSAVEVDRIGFQCERLGGHHLNADVCHVRVAGDDGRDAAPGEVGDVIVSNLLNRATVVLNYRLGDRAALDPGRCGCGRTLPLLASLEGRRSELVRLEDGREVSALVLNQLFEAELAATLKSQLRQSGPGVLRWAVVPGPGADPAAIRSAMLARAGDVLSGSTVEIDIVDDIEPTTRGKFRSAVVG